ncbi:MAG: rhomboid family intramembrane serine protease [Oligoflexales bacterium]|nr:rhomboid family intramembrane serine protease [Oligoflexales bacterium]
MRKVTSFEDKAVTQDFRCVLLSAGLDLKLERPEDETERSSREVWILNDDDRERAQGLLDLYMSSSPAGSSPAVQAMIQEGRKKFQKALATEAEALKKKLDLREAQRSAGLNSFFSGGRERHLNVTFAVIIISALFFMAQPFDKTRQLFSLFSYSQDAFSQILGLKSFLEIRSGQIWRLVTPIFIHSDFFHILFNAIWFYQLGSVIEKRQGSRHLLGLVIAIAVFSNTAFYLVAGPAFGGLSGVVYGLAFYMWAADRFATRPVYGVDPQLVRFFLVFYVLCWILSAIGLRVANTVHGVGALTGVIFAFFSTSYYKSFFAESFMKKSRKSEIVYNILIGLALLVGAAVTDYLLY